MKKILAILLIAVVAGEAIEEIRLESISELWKEIKNTVPKLWDKLTGVDKRGFYWFKEHGLLDKAKEILASSGKTAAVTFCSNYLSRSVCDRLMDESTINDLDET